MLWNWVNTQISLRRMPWLIFKLTILNLVVDIVTITVMKKMGAVPPAGSGAKIMTMSVATLIILLPIAALGEEIIFRLLPLIFAVNFFGTSRKILIVAVVASVIFGCMHGSVYNIFLQGLGGFLYCLIFLKCGGLQRKFTAATLASASSHLLFNSILVSIVFLGT